MSSLRRPVYGRLDPADHRQLQQDAAARGISMASCLADCLREYYLFRRDMASATAAPGEPGAQHTGLIHTLFARTEERLASTLDAHATERSEGQRRIENRMDRIESKVDRLESMVDRLVMLYLVHTPEVGGERSREALASASRRIASYRQAVDDRVAGERRDGSERNPRPNDPREA
jgi:hypothetical protein